MSLSCCKASTIAWYLGGLLLLGSGTAATLHYLGVFSRAQTSNQQGDAGKPQERRKVPVPKVRFTDITQDAGIRFVHHNGGTDHKLLPETMCGGVAVIDFDNDGKPDILFTNACPWPDSPPRRQGQQPTLALYHNDGGGKFTDVTKEAGLALTFYGMGATVGDYDNDGWPDLFVTGVGGNHLFHNEDGKFTDVTATAGVGGPGGWPNTLSGSFFQWTNPLCFSSSASFLDYDGDGKLDLFVCNYVRWSPAYDLSIESSLTGKGRTYGQPKQFDGALCLLYHNEGGGKLKDVSKESGVQVFEQQGTDASARRLPVGKSLGVIVCDADEDGWPDIFVANDTTRNFLFHNQPSGERGRVSAPSGERVFAEKGVNAGVAYAEGVTRGAMGIDWAPSYRGHCNALLIGNFANEPDTFLCQDDPKQLVFMDQARPQGIAGPSRMLLKFGAFFFDYDLDGRLDFLTSNGHLDPSISKLQAGQRYAQPPQLFWSKPKQGFEAVTEEAAGPDLFQPLVGRGCAYADLDGDGDLDVILVGNGGPARVLRNDNQLGHHWIRLRLEGDGVHSNRSAIGARVVLEANGVEQRREIAAARGYLSQSEMVVTFGLGDTTTIDRITIYWPGKDGGKTVLKNLAIDQQHTVAQGRK
ncbi:MAG TPA: CRTAC1 family protein [Gemmataceae bacterium]|nr:CRTAC1 family protein [Gemmataceae bacterium]